MDKCSICGAPIENGKCAYCGATFTQINTNKEQYQQQFQSQPQSQQQPQPQIIINNTVTNSAINGGFMHSASYKDKTVALILCILLGYFGAHRFYVGKTGMGLLYLFTGGIFGIGWIIDIFLIAGGSFTDSNGLPLK
ncbi:TM2 domain-containing protein [Clostridium sp. UBA1056]|uniref:TM2 domain-containing protein n=1 Tax=unclassified Clostridium TaxID=2614128 RepID=UPI003216BFDC